MARATATAPSEPPDRRATTQRRLTRSGHDPGPPGPPGPAETTGPAQSRDSTDQVGHHQHASGWRRTQARTWSPRSCSRMHETEATSTPPRWSGRRPEAAMSQPGVGECSLVGDIEMDVSASRQRTDSCVAGWPPRSARPANQCRCRGGDAAWRCELDPGADPGAGNDFVRRRVAHPVADPTSYRFHGQVVGVELAVLDERRSRQIVALMATPIRQVFGDRGTPTYLGWFEVANRNNP